MTLKNKVLLPSKLYQNNYSHSAQVATPNKDKKQKGVSTFEINKTLNRVTSYSHFQ